MRSAVTPRTILGAVGGLATGYVLWLAAVSIVNDNAAAGRWGPVVLVVSVVLAVCAALWGMLARRRKKFLWAAFGFALPILPVVLTAAVLADVYF